MIRSAAVARLLGLASALASFAFLASCGSGAVSGTPTANDPAHITILPAAATAFSGLPTTFVISGGTNSYIVSSSNQSIIPVSGGITGGSLTIVPNPVVADTTVTLTVRDTGTTPIATATVTVKPGTVANNITITASSTQGSSCLPTGVTQAVCSGGDAIVSTTISQGGIPLPARGVRFDVVTGNFSFIVTDPVTGVDTLTNTVTVITDQAGNAQARIRVAADAPNQTALLQITDLGTSAFQRTAFVIAQATGTSPGFFTVPESITFQGPLLNQCADSSVSGTIAIFGGSPPYSVLSTTNAFKVSRDTVSFSGGSFDVSPTGICVGTPGLPIVVRDTSGRTAQTLVANVAGTATLPPFTVAPSTITLSSCAGTASFTASGGTGNFVARSGSDTIFVNLKNGLFTVGRTPTSAPPGGDVSIGVTDGQSTQSVTVHFSGEAAGACGPIKANPSTVTLTSCSAAQTVALSGGNSYTATSNSPAVAVSVSGSTLTVQRAVPSGAFSSAATVTVNSDEGTTSVTVNGSGAGALSCP